MSKNVKGAIIVLVFAIVAFIVYKYIYKKGGSRGLTKGYAKKAGEWLGCSVNDYDDKYYSAINSAGVTIYFNKSDAKTRKDYTTKKETCADAARDMTVYTKA